MNIQRSLWSAVLALAVTLPVQAGITLVPGLTEPQLNAAAAVQNIYFEYQTRLDAGETLSHGEQELFEEARKLVHTANEILQNGGPTTYSLQVDAEGLSFALQWVAHEEFSTQGKLSGEAVGAQLANIAARIETLRQGVPGLAAAASSQAVHGFVADRSIALATGGSAGDGYLGNERWGAFLNAGFAFGERDPTANEDAFDFDSVGVTAGADYRLRPDWVVGTALGFNDLRADFDSSLSVVDGEIQSKGWSLSAYSTLNREHWYVDGVLGYGASEFDTERRITYPSNNPLVPPTDFTALGNTDSSQFTASLGSGYLGNLGAWGWGGFANLNFAEARIDGYRERNAEYFNLEIDAQGIRSLTSSLGVQGSYVFSLPFGVVIPQLRAQWLHEFKDDVRFIGARFINDTTGNFFAVPTDRPDANYGLLSADLSAVLKHGLQAFFSYQTPVGLRYLNAHALTGGVRWEF